MSKPTCMRPFRLLTTVANRALPILKGNGFTKFVIACSAGLLLSACNSDSSSDSGNINNAHEKPEMNDSPGNTGSKPVAHNDSVEVSANSKMNTIYVLANDSGLETPVSIQVNDNASNGTVTESSDNTFSYTPEQGFSGSDSFSYQITSANGNSNIATVSIFVIEEAQSGDSPILGENDTTNSLDECQ